MQENYQSRCLVTTEHTLPALEAAHIVPYSLEASHDLSNGLLLRRDVHALFDEGWVTVTPEMKFKVSPKVKEIYNNGTVYYDLQGALHLPEGATAPDRDRLQWHSREIYKG